MTMLMARPSDEQEIYPQHKDWTVDDLERLPDDGYRYELVDGVLLVSPAPTPLHQRAVVRLTVLLDKACPDELEVFVAPLDFQPTKRRSLQPDVLVTRRSDVGPKKLTRPPLLVVEVLSPRTAMVDLNLKSKVYADSGVESFWVIDPKHEYFTGHLLENGGYKEVVTATSEEHVIVERPFEVTLCPHDLVS